MGAHLPGERFRVQGLGFKRFGAHGSGSNSASCTSKPGKSSPSANKSRDTKRPKPKNPKVSGGWTLLDLSAARHLSDGYKQYPQMHRVTAAPHTKEHLVSWGSGAWTVQGFGTWTASIERLTPLFQLGVWGVEGLGYRV